MNPATQQFGKVGVLFGGASSEREVSMMSGTGVLNALRTRGVDAHAFDPATQSLGDLEVAKFDRVFIALHGRGGEDGSIQGVLETLRIPYTGSGVQASAIAIDKVFTKRIWETHSLPTPRYRLVESSERKHLNEVADDLRLPLIVKPPNEGSTIGISRVLGYSDMSAAFALARKYDEVVMAEEFIDGRELTCAVVGQGACAQAFPRSRSVRPELTTTITTSTSATRRSTCARRRSRRGSAKRFRHSQCAPTTLSARAAGAVSTSC